MPTARRNRRRSRYAPWCPRCVAVVGVLAPRRGVEVRLGTTVVAEDHRHLLVDARRCQVDHRHHLRRRTQEHRGEGHRVDAEVQERTAPQLRVEPSRRRVVVKVLTVIGLHTATMSPISPVRDQLVDRGHVGQTPGPHRLHQEQVLRPRERHQIDRLASRVMVKAFSTSTGLPLSKRQLAFSKCIGCGVADVDGVDVGVAVPTLRRSRSDARCRSGRQRCWPTRSVREPTATATPLSVY